MPSAISTMFESSIARVIGPTPPGFGDTQRRHLGHVVGHVAGHLAVHARDADVEHRGARLHDVGADDARYAGRGDHDVGVPHVRTQVLRAGVAEGDRRVLGTPREQQSQRPADRQPAPDDDHLGAGDLHAVPPQQLDHADGRARQRTGLAEDQLAEVGGVQPVDVLVRVDPGEQRELVEPGRLLDDEAGALGVGVQLVDDGLDLGLGGGRREVAADRGDADLGAVLVLGADVPVRAGVVADQHGAEAGRDAPRLQRRDPFGQLGLDGREGGLAVEDLGGHRVPIAWSLCLLTSMVSRLAPSRARSVARAHARPAHLHAPPLARRS